jgi:hypothetical protein
MHRTTQLNYNMCDITASSLRHVSAWQCHPQGVENKLKIVYGKKENPLNPSKRNLIFYDFCTVHCNTITQYFNTVTQYCNTITHYCNTIKQYCNTITQYCNSYTIL